MSAFGALTELDGSSQIVGILEQSASLSIGNVETASGRGKTLQPSKFRSSRFGASTFPEANADNQNADRCDCRKFPDYQMLVAIPFEDLSGREVLEIGLGWISVSAPRRGGS
ncbi:hypothetical protein G8O24_24740 [Bradyrhizobium sp. INPA01-394B]|uniref:Uncharacterized protein n=1 Tax=Bradyrhizobium campsiandrae TaxID=1729892 RepID=A0ABR7UBR3_9BRAD|nr:hypothetical protein [Bradyrhizobium campsiandrae]MBC9880538.1 hypothetical protein [Bradyrhizobium campsiandrae]MBC9981021.1 hypothetical protein [Bradyrhizobium campsiandrae]